MRGQSIFSITDFAHFARTTRDTLLYYDKIGLLSPVSRGENHYRFYSSAQLAAVNLIRSCQALGMPLSEIKQLVHFRTPEIMTEHLEEQISLVDNHIDEWVRARKLLHFLKNNIRSVSDIDESKITLRRLPAEAIVLGALNDFSGGRDDYDALLDFYHSCQDKYPDMDLNYPVWGLHCEEKVKRREWTLPDRYYFNNPDGYDKKPAALYVTGYKRGGYGKGGDLFERLDDYITINGLEVCGPAYEEYPLNEICVADNENYLLRVMITVRERRKEERE